MAPRVNHLWSKTSPLLDDISRYRCLVGKTFLDDISHSYWLDIVYVVGVVSQFMAKPKQCHLDVAMRILEDIKGSIKRNGELRIEAYSNVSYVSDRSEVRS